MKLSGVRIAVFGARGMLAADVIPLLRAKGAELSLFDREAGERDGQAIAVADLTQEPQVASALTKVSPQVVFNLAAYTAVDLAEKEYSAAFAVNAMGPLYIARWLAGRADSRLVHISTDYVFGANPELAKRRQPVAEDAPAMPCGIYGESKRMGEELVQALLPNRSLIVRTSWLHGLAGPNFVDTIRRVLHERAASAEPQPLRVVDDQFGSPTWCPWLASILLELVEGEHSGVFHASSRGDLSWFDFAKEIARFEDIAVPVLPQSSAELNRPAPRPAYSTLSVKKLESVLGRACPDWKEGLHAHLVARRSII